MGSAANVKADAYDAARADPAFIAAFDHDLAAFVSIGTGTVSEDGSVIASDPGVGVIKAGWHCGGNPNTVGSADVTLTPSSVAGRPALEVSDIVLEYGIQTPRLAAHPAVANSNQNHFGGGSLSGIAQPAQRTLPAAAPPVLPTATPPLDPAVPPEQRMDVRKGINKVLVREHIARRFPQLPYVRAKGSFRFDLRKLAQQRFDQVYEYSLQARDILPGAPAWLMRHRCRMSNKYHASKFYLLAIALPWVAQHATSHLCPRTAPDGVDVVPRMFARLRR